MDFDEKLKRIFLCFLIMVFGLILFKYIPIDLFGNEILFDASAHIVITAFILYVLWYFVDKNATLITPYLIFSAVVLVIVAINRFLIGAHDDVGVLLGLAISVVAIIISRWDYFKGRFLF